MSGVPLPVSDIPAGTVTVRVVRGSLANVVAGQEVELVVGGVSRTATTNEVGRAEFSGLAAGARAQASTAVGAERLASQPFEIPASGGIRLMLVAADPAGAPSGAAGDPPAAAAAAQPGTVTLGEQSRFVFEMADEALTGFYILQVVNRTATPVSPPRPFTLDLPEGAVQGTILQGSSPQGSIASRRLTIAGPFAPGSTIVQVAFTLPYSAGTLDIAQTLPVALAQVTLLVEKVGELQVASPRITERRDVSAQGDTYVLGQGPGLQAGESLQITLSGLPVHPAWPRNLALGLALLILLVGGWASLRPGPATTAWEARRQRLDLKRERLFDQLAALEDQHRAGSVAADRYAARRAELIDALERVYTETDEEAAA